ncbi:MAG: hypothetical protein ACI8UO_006274 [Verrucomicrobiales bacterium]|jgi:hypothetical protein
MNEKGIAGSYLPRARNPFKAMITKMKKRLAILFSALLLAAAAGGSDALTPPSDPGEILTWLEEHWKGSGWGANGSQGYMRPLDDEGWKARMLAMQALIKVGADSIPALTTALGSDNVELQIFAAQVLGYLPGEAPAEPLIELLKNHKSPAVRIYAADSLGMKGGAKHKPLFQQLLGSEKHRDVKKHLGYAIEREAKPVDPVVIETLKNWDPKSIDSAVIGEPAPDFELQALRGEKIKLSEFRGKSAVILVFIYGDT